MFFLTGVKPTGSQLHLGNYISTIKPIRDFLNKGHSGYLFIADAHALNIYPDPSELKNNSINLLACICSFFKNEIEQGKLFVYRQSQIPDLFQLSFCISQFCSKGLMNRMHVYKILTEDNIKNNRDIDYHVNMGTFTYPILMSADIISLDADIIPVGQDQLQHIEVAKEIVRVCNNFCKKEIFKEPKAFIQTEVVLPGTDGRKMSKSYNNTIKLFEEERKLKKLVNSIPTNSKNVGEPKFSGESVVTDIFKELVSEEKYEYLLDIMSRGAGWGDIKNGLYKEILNITKDIDCDYSRYINEPAEILETIKNGEEAVKSKISKKLFHLKDAVGLWN